MAVNNDANGSTKEQKESTGSIQNYGRLLGVEDLSGDQGRLAVVQLFRKNPSSRGKAETPSRILLSRGGRSGGSCEVSGSNCQWMARGSWAQVRPAGKFHSTPKPIHRRLDRDGRQEIRSASEIHQQVCGVPQYNRRRDPRHESSGPCERAIRAGNTTRSLIANAKALFTDKVPEAIGASADDLTTIPLRQLPLPARNKSRYTSRFDANNLVLTAAAELGIADPDAEDEEIASCYEQWKIRYLALVAGLRYKEIDRLRVQGIFSTAGRIFVRRHETFRPKTDASEGEVLINPKAAEVLCEMLKHPKGPWFIKDGPSTLALERLDRPLVQRLVLLDKFFQQQDRITMVDRLQMLTQRLAADGDAFEPQCSPTEAGT